MFQQHACYPHKHWGRWRCGTEWIQSVPSKTVSSHVRQAGPRRAQHHEPSIGLVHPTETVSYTLLIFIFCRQFCVSQHFSSSTRLSSLHTPPLQFSILTSKIVKLDLLFLLTRGPGPLSGKSYATPCCPKVLGRHTV